MFEMRPFLAWAVPQRILRWFDCEEQCLQTGSEVLSDEGPNWFLGRRLVPPLFQARHLISMA